MSFTYQESDIHRRYDRGRTLASDATRALMDALRRHVPDAIRLIVDLGSGTGRFTSPLADTFGATAVGVEPAANMRATADGKRHSAHVHFVAGAADAIPLDDRSVDLVFMSQVLHHLADRPAAFREIGRVLKPAGYLCVRQTTRENLDSYFYQRFFPEARAVDDGRLMCRTDLLSLGRTCRYRLLARETLRHEIAEDAIHYVERIALRAYSDLECIADTAFHQGLARLRAFASAHPDFSRFAENELFVFGR